MKMWHLATVADALAHDFYAGAAKFDVKGREVVVELSKTASKRHTKRTTTAFLRRFARRVRDRLRR